MVARWWIGVGLVVVGIGALARLGSAEEAGNPAPRAGMQAHVDPATGKLLQEPAVPPPAQALPSRRPPLAEVPAPGGGTMVELDGRFMSTMTATLDADGSIRIDCTTGSAAHAPAAH